MGTTFLRLPNINNFVTYITMHSISNFLSRVSLLLWLTTPFCSELLRLLFFTFLQKCRPLYNILQLTDKCLLFLTYPLKIPQKFSVGCKTEKPQSCCHTHTHWTVLFPYCIHVLLLQYIFLTNAKFVSGQGIPKEKPLP